MAMKYLKNLGSSIGRASLDALGDLNPVISGHITENKEFVKENFSKLREYVTSDTGMKNGEYYKTSKNLIKNALREIKTGELYAKESSEELFTSMADSIGVDLSSMDFDFDFEEEGGSDFKATSSSKSDTKTEKMFKKETQDGKTVDITNNSTKNFHRNTVNNIMMSSGGSSKTTNKILSSSAKAMLQASQASTSALLEGISVITAFQNETTVNFYNDVSSKLADIGNILSNFQTMFQAGEKEEEHKVYGNELEDFLLNGNRLEFYKRKLQNNSSSGAMGNLKDLITQDLLPMYQQIASNPMGLLLREGIKALIPKSIKNSMGRLNDTMENLPTALQFMLRKWKGSDNKLKSFIGNLFGVDFTKKPELNFGGYKKGPIPFDGVTKRAITNVIPSLLGKILSAVSSDPIHKQELVYDYEKGKFTTQEIIKKYVRQELDKKSVDLPMGEYKNRAYKSFEKGELNEQAEKDLSEAFKRIVEKAIIPDESIAEGYISKNKSVEKAIRKMYSQFSFEEMSKFQKDILMGLSSRNSVIEKLNKNDSYHNAFDIDTSMIRSVNEAEDKKAKMTLQQKLKLANVNDNIITKLLSRNADNGEETVDTLNVIANGIDSLNNQLLKFLYGKEKMEAMKIEYDSEEESFYSMFDTKSSATKARNGRRYNNVNMNANVVNLYANSVNSGKNSIIKNGTGNPIIDSIADGSHKDGIDNIPHDGYVAITHKGEAILTAEENRKRKEEEEAKKKGLKGIVSDTMSGVNDKVKNIRDSISIERDENGKASIKISGQGIIEYVKTKVIDPVSKFMDEKIFTPVSNFFTNKVINPMKKAFTTAKDYIKENVWTPLKDSISEALSPMKKRISNWFGDKKERLKAWGRENLLGGMTLSDWWSVKDEKIKNGVGSLSARIRGIGDKIPSGSQIKSNIEQKREEMLERSRQLKEEALSKINKGAGNALGRMDAIRNSEMIKNAKNKAQDVVNNGKEAFERTKNRFKGNKSEAEVVSLDENSNRRIINIDKNVEDIRDTLNDFYNAFLASKGLDNEGFSGSKKSRGLFGKVKNFFKGKFEKFKGLVSNPMQFIGKKLGKVFDGVKNTFNNALKGVKSIFNGIKNTAKALSETVGKGVKAIGGFVKDNLPKVIKGISNAANKVYEDAKGLAKKMLKGAGTLLSGAKEAVKTLYGDFKKVAKEVWGTAKSAVSTVWGSLFGGNKKGKKSNKMEVVISGGYLDGIRETVHVTTKKKNSSYDDIKAKMAEEEAEDQAERDKTSRIGLLGRMKNAMNIKAYRERLAQMFGGGIDWVKDKIKNSEIYQRAVNLKNKAVNKLANNTMRGPLGSIGRAIGRTMMNPQDYTEAGITPVHIYSSDVNMGSEGVGQELANTLMGDGTGVGKKGGLFSRMLSKFMDSKIGGKLFNTRIGSKVLDLMTNGKGFFGNAKSLWTGANSAIMNTSIGGKLATVGGKVAGVGSSALGKLAGMGTIGAKAAGALGKVGSLAGGAAKFLGPLGLAITAGKGVFDGVKGWKNANETFGTNDATFGQKLSSATGSILSGLSFGLLNSEKSSKFVHKAGTTLTNLIPGVGAYRWYKKRKEEKEKEEKRNEIVAKKSKERAERLAYENKTMSESSSTLYEQKQSLKNSNQLAVGQSSITNEIGSNSGSSATRINTTDLTKMSESTNMASGLIPFVSPTLLQGRNLITAYRHNKKKEDEAEKKLLQQMSPEEREAYLASKSNSEFMKGKNALNPLQGLLSLLSGGDLTGNLTGSKKKKNSLFKSISNSFKKMTGLLGLTAYGASATDDEKKASDSIFSKFKNFISGKGWKSDAELEASNNSSSSSGSNTSTADGSALGVSSIKDIWKLSAKYEVGFDGTHGRGKGSGKISNNAGDYGGASYGIPQFSLTQGSLQSFVESLKGTAPDLYSQLAKYPLGSSQFNEAWYNIAEIDGERFAQLQTDYTKENYYGAIKKNLKNNYGLDLDKRSLALNAIAYSTAVQYGSGSLGQSHFKNAINKFGGNQATISDENLIIGVQDSKYQNVDSNFRSSSAEIRNGVRNRINREKEDALAILKSENVSSQATTSTGNKIVQAARTQLGVPYQWGGTTPGKGLDCSGLTQYAYKQAGTPISRTTYTQVKEGVEVSQADAKPGDLIFSNWSNSSTPEHVSIYTGGNKRIHAPQTGDVVKEANLPAGRLMFRRLYGAGGPLLEAAKGVVSSGFGNRIDPITGKKGFHSGIDIANEEGTPISAYADGIVDFAGFDKDYGNVLKINHGNGLSTVYGHNSKLNVKLGDYVKKNSTIASMGSTGRATGSHLHFEMRKNGQYVNPTTYKDSVRTVTNSSSTTIDSVYKETNDKERMAKYNEMLNIMASIANNTGITNELLEKMYSLLNDKFKKDEKSSSEQKTTVNRNNPFISGLDPDIDLIAKGV